MKSTVSDDDDLTLPTSGDSEESTIDDNEFNTSVAGEGMSADPLESLRNPINPTSGTIFDELPFDAFPEEYADYFLNGNNGD